MPELLISCQDLAKAFGAAPLFAGLSFGLFEGDHVGLVGPQRVGQVDAAEDPGRARASLGRHSRRPQAAAAGLRSPGSMFRAEQLDTPVGRLSGGEQARALIARLMLEPADVLLLDERPRAGAGEGGGRGGGGGRSAERAPGRPPRTGDGV